MDKKARNLKIWWRVLAVLGGFLAFGGLLANIGAFIFLSDSTDTLGVMVVGVGLVCLLLGLAMIWAGLTGDRGTPSPVLYSRQSLMLLAVLSVVVLVIAWVIPADYQTTLFFAPLHAAAILFPALFLVLLLTLLMGKEDALTLRQMVVSLFGGAASVLLAFPVEIIGFFLSALFVGVIAYFIPGGMSEIKSLTTLFDKLSNGMASEADLMILLASPVVLGVLALTLSVVTPLIEEFGKVLILAGMGFWKKPSLTRAFVWGAVCGLGFAIVEGIGNGSMGLGVQSEWLLGVGFRIFATMMHAMSSGLIGLGWGLFWQKRWWALPLSYVAAVLLHSFWNFNVILMVGGSGVLENNPVLGAVLLFSGVIFLGGLCLLVPLGLCLTPGLLRKYASRHAPPAVQSAGVVSVALEQPFSSEAHAELL